MITAKRDSYIDFMRSIGLILIIGVHVAAPTWYVVARSFDVPLMVFVSMLCVKPLNGGYLTYCKKRFKRIYIPVAVFLTIFFVLDFGIRYALGLETKSFITVIGSFMLLNTPGIGYMWIMRVFLLIALVMPLLYKLVHGRPFWVVCTAAFGLLAVQQILIYAVDLIPQTLVRFAVDKTLLYVTGYSSVAIIGLRMTSMTRAQMSVVIAVCVAFISVFIAFRGAYNPQNYKYPPQAPYMIYGILGSVVIYMLRPVLCGVARWPFWAYVSVNSMWIYLWHIIPVYLIGRWMELPDMWFARFVAVLLGALILNHLWRIVVSPLPAPARQLMG